MAKRNEKWKGEGSHLRSRSNETTDKAEACARRAWQCLALAGAPRVARTARDKYVAEAASLFDSARGFLTTARDAFFALVRRVDTAEARKRERPAVERWDNYSAQTASEKAGVTVLQPVVGSLTTDLRTLGETLRKYGAALVRRSARGELDAADRLRRSLFGLDPPFQRCAWCSKAEDRHFPHYALDAEGYACERKEGRRFCCTSCFWDGKDLQEPAPKPLPPEPAAPEAAYAEVNPTRALPARRLALPAHVPSEAPQGPGRER